MLMCIGTLIQNNKTVGFRLSDTETKTTKEVTYDSLYDALNNKTIDVKNLRAINGKILGYSGSLGRYTAINFKTGEIIGKPTYVLISKCYRNNRYRVMDINGHIQILDSKQILNYELANAEIDEFNEVHAINGEIESEELNGISILYRITYFIYICRDNFSGRIFITNMADIEDMKNAGRIDEVKFDCNLKELFGAKEELLRQAFKHNTPLFGMACIDGLTDDAIKEILRYTEKKRDEKIVDWMLATGKSLAGIRFQLNGTQLELVINDTVCTNEEGESLISALRVDLTNGVIYILQNNDWLICKFCSKNTVYKRIAPSKKKELIKNKIIL